MHQGRRANTSIPEEGAAVKAGRPLKSSCADENGEGEWEDVQQQDDWLRSIPVAAPEIATMTRKRLLLWLLACIAFFTVGFILLSLKTGPRINQASFDQIQEGMTEAEVVEILGSPAGDYGPGSDFVFYLPRRGWLGSPTDERRWSAGEFAITVTFDHERRVFAKKSEEVKLRFPPQQGVLKKLRNWCSSAFSRWL